MTMTALLTRPGPPPETNRQRSWSFSYARIAVMLEPLLRGCASESKQDQGGRRLRQPFENISEYRRKRNGHSFKNKAAHVWPMW